MRGHDILGGDFNEICIYSKDRLCGLVVRVPGYRSRDLGSIPNVTKFSEK
jgi:hypothetical protein